MIKDKRIIKINATPIEVFNFLEMTPNKFPIFKIFETRPFLFIRISCLDGIRTGLKVALDNTIQSEMSKKERKPLKIGSKLGPNELRGREI
mgnify:CR=1 FL=1